MDCYMENTMISGDLWSAVAEVLCIWRDPQLRHKHLYQLTQFMKDLLFFFRHFFSFTPDTQEFTAAYSTLVAEINISHWSKPQKVLSILLNSQWFTSLSTLLCQVKHAGENRHYSSHGICTVKNASPPSLTISDIHSVQAFDTIVYKHQYYMSQSVTKFEISGMI